MIDQQASFHQIDLPITQLIELLIFLPFYYLFIRRMLKKKVQNYILDLHQILGVGSFGTVYKGTDSLTDELLAIKTISKTTIQQHQYLLPALKLEIKTLHQLSSPYIVQQKKVIQTQHFIYIVLEYCEGGTLANYIKKKQFFQEKQAIQFLAQIITGYYQIIKSGIIHRDLKPDNLLLKDGKIKIADFGLSAKSGLKSNLRSEVGTPAYQSPQVLLGEGYNFKCDIWAIGLIYYEMLYGKLPWKCQNGKLYYQRVIRQNKLIFPKQPYVTDQSKNFILNCLKYKEKQRADWSDIFESIILKDKVPNFTEIKEEFAAIVKIIKSVLSQQKSSLKLIKQKQREREQTKQKQREREQTKQKQRYPEQMSRKQFHSLIKGAQKQIHHKTIDYAFAQIDTNNNGQIQTDELQNIIQHFDTLYQEQQFPLLKILGLQLNNHLDEIEEQKLSSKKSFQLKLRSQLTRNFDVNKIYSLVCHLETDLIAQHTNCYQAFSQFARNIYPSMTSQQLQLFYVMFFDHATQNINCEQLMSYIITLMKHKSQKL